MKIGWRIAFAIVGILFSIGLIKYLMQGPQGEAVVLRAPPTPMPIQVHVGGAVLAAGVYTLPVGSRVLDAVEAAGGFSLQANTEGINLAAYLEDGERIQIPILAATPAPSKNTEIEITSDFKPVDNINLINLNTANQQELETLPGIGPVLAQEIIAYRELNGSFSDIDEILNVKGIGTVKYEQIRELITVGDMP
jgi:competence protein ComEA